MPYQVKKVKGSALFERIRVDGVTYHADSITHEQAEMIAKRSGYFASLFERVPEPKKQALKTEATEEGKED